MLKSTATWSAVFSTTATRNAVWSRRRSSESRRYREDVDLDPPRRFRAASPVPRLVDSIDAATRLGSLREPGGGWRHDVQHAVSAAHPGTQTRGIIIGHGTATQMPCARSLRRTPPLTCIAGTCPREPGPGALPSGGPIIDSDIRAPLSRLVTASNA